MSNRFPESRKESTGKQSFDVDDAEELDVEAPDELSCWSRRKDEGEGEAKAGGGDVELSSRTRRGADLSGPEVVGKLEDLTMVRITECASKE